MVTGCCGRLGRAVANTLLADGWAVRGFDCNERPSSLNLGVEYSRGDLADAAAVRAAVTGAKAVVHLAACPDDADLARALVPSNIIGVANVLEACRADDHQTVERVVVASSGKVHAGHSGALPIRTSDPVSVVCNYGAAKLFAEGAAQALANSAAGSVSVTVIRFAWSPRTPADVAAMRAATAIAQGADEFLSPRDAATCVSAALRAPPRPFTLLFCQSIPPVGRSARFDLSETTARLGWAPADTFPAGIDELCASDYTPNPHLYARR